MATSPWLAAVKIELTKLKKAKYAGKDIMAKAIAAAKKNYKKAAPKK